MWITQTYLGSVEPDADIFVYYLYEDYVNEQKNFTEMVQTDLERLGDTFNEDVSLLMPNPKYADKIESEVREIRPLWMHVKGSLPGLLISPVPLVKLDRFTEECYFIPFDVRSRFMVTDTIKKARSLISEELSVKRTHRDNEVKPAYRRIGEAIELKPGLFGFRIDLKKLFASTR